MRTETGQRITVIQGHPDPREARFCHALAWAHEGRIAPLAQLMGLALLPLAGAIAGLLLDERDHLGFTNWRGACFAAGFSFRTTLAFSFELLPTAIVGLLAGGLTLQVIGFGLGNRGQAKLCLAAHAGCALTMPIGMSLCAFALPLSALLAADVLLACAGAWIVKRFFIRSAPYPRGELSVVDRIPAR